MLQYCKDKCDPKSTPDPRATCRECPKGRVIQKYDNIFVHYLNTMWDLFFRIRAGWHVENNDIDYTDWQTLSILTAHYEAKQIEAIAGAMATVAAVR